MNDTALLRWQNSGSPSDVARELAEIAPGFERRAWGRRGVGVFAGLVLVGLMAEFLSAVWHGSDGGAPAIATKPPAPAATGIATVTRVVGVQWEPAAVVWPELSRLTIGDVLRFEAGEVSLVYDSGVEVSIRGTADFEVRATDRAFSRLGLITARVGRDGSGFTIETPVATVVDLSTEFVVARPAAIFVFLSDAMPVPDWLRRHFFDTGERFGLDEGRNRHVPSRRSGIAPGKSIDTVFSVWRRDVDEAATVTFGAPVQPEGVTGFNMYGIAAVPLVDSSLPATPGKGSAP